MKAAKSICFLFVFSFFFITVPMVHAEIVNYTLENVILDDNNAQMFGSFSWTYDVGDFENGVGQFDFLDIPFTLHDHTDLNATFDIGSSIEITLEGSVHDDGVDITLFLLQPLSPTTGSEINLAQSRFEIGGNGFHTGIFLSGSIVPSDVVAVEDLSALPTSTLTAYPNPFNPATKISYAIPGDDFVSLMIYSVDGRMVQTLVNEQQPMGRYEVIWNGEDENGRRVASGTYLYRLNAGQFSELKKMTLVK